LQKLMDLVKQEGLEDVLVVVGGVIPNKDIPVLNDLGVKGNLPRGRPFR
jgi:methylmalonyl-CoA mutase, C-terminal domain